MILSLEPRAAVFVSIAAWTMIGVITGFVASRLPVSVVGHDTWLTRIRSFEDDGRIYQRHLRINRWKSLLPEAGGLFPGGVSKRHIGGRNDDALIAFCAETRRAEIVHWTNLFAGVLFVIWCPPVIAAVMITFGVVVHLPFIIVQRSNRGSLQRVLAGRRRRSGRRRS